MSKKEILSQHWAKWANKRYAATEVFKPENFKDIHQWIYDAMDEWAATLEKENKLLHERIERMTNEL